VVRRPSVDIMKTSEERRRTLVSMRAALLLLAGALVGIGAGILTAMSGEVAPKAILAGGAAGTAAVLALNDLVERR